MCIPNGNADLQNRRALALFRGDYKIAEEITDELVARKEAQIKEPPAPKKFIIMRTKTLRLQSYVRGTARYVPAEEYDASKFRYTPRDKRKMALDSHGLYPNGIFGKV